MKKIVSILLFLVCVNGYGDEDRLPHGHGEGSLITIKTLYGVEVVDQSGEWIDPYWCGCEDLPEKEWQDYDHHEVTVNRYIRTEGLEYCHKNKKYRKVNYEQVD